MGRRGRKPQKERKGYFYEEQEQAFIDYISTDDKEEKEKIFNAHLLVPFTKMVESIIRCYNLYIPDEEFEETFNDTISFLITKMDKFKPEKGCKAYSYCGTICKHYLLHKINQFSKNQKRQIATDIGAVMGEDTRYTYTITPGENPVASELVNMSLDVIQNILDNKDTNKLSANEIKIGQALINLMTNWDDIFAEMGSNKFNKSSILLFLKETTLLNTKEIFNAMKKYKSAYYSHKKELIDNIYS